ncbi:uncharacterized protein K02A2.6-like [Rhipicephalus sanguineus]|uniref:uncharacterized protein K02A2.6-like n=1 Tax=Rhipicephalus sanguineus TaxID=34632 RepID=UPI0020C48E47|nr:uncharacterized protein K02A2.6-like [Rhipicephalus sanguineus]
MLVEEFADLFEDRLGCCKGPPVKLYKKEGAVPRSLKARPVPFALRKAVSAEIDRLVQQGVLSPVSVSEWAAPVVPVVKKNGDIRLCGDFKLTVNPATHLEQYPLPKVDDIFAALYGGEVFTTLDLRNAYNQLPLDEEAKEMTVINTHQALYSYNRLAFGISSAPALFQRRIESLLRDLPRVRVYLDDIIIAEKQQDTSTLRQVFQRLRDNGLQLNKAKCRFREKEVQFLGHKIDATGLHPLRDNLEAVTAAPKPESQMIALTQEDSALRQVREWIEQGWPSHLAGKQQHLQPYFTRRSTPLESGKSPAQLLLGFEPRTRLSAHFPEGEVPAGADTIQPSSTKAPPLFPPGKPVWSRHIQRGRKWLPGTVIATEGNRMVKVETPLGTHRHHVDQLRARRALATPEKKESRLGSSLAEPQPDADAREASATLNFSPAAPRSPGSTQETGAPEAVPTQLRRSTRTRRPPERLGF